MRKWIPTIVAGIALLSGVVLWRLAKERQAQHMTTNFVRIFVETSPVQGPYPPGVIYETSEPTKIKELCELFPELGRSADQATPFEWKGLGKVKFVPSHGTSTIVYFDDLFWTEGKGQRPLMTGFAGKLTSLVQKRNEEAKTPR